jgi:hypothetical protein
LDDLVKKNPNYASSTWRGIISAIYYFINTNNYSLSKEAFEKIKLFQKALENKTNYEFRMAGKFKKQAEMLDPEDLIYLFNNWKPTNYISMRNLCCIYLFHNYINLGNFSL